MAIAKNSRLAVQATSRSTSRPRTPRISVPVLFAVGAVISFAAAATFTQPGAVALADARAFLEYFAGVFSLVSLSIATMVGLAATDRIILLIRHRVLLQAVHRATAFFAMLFLGIHILLKVLEAHASPIDVVVPFMTRGQGPFVIYMGLGTIASYLMIVATWTGLIRGRFAGSAHPGLWRLLHATAYVAWPFAIVHGLMAGRHARTWVTVSYIVCVTLVVVGLLIRITVTWSRRLSAPKATTTGAIKPVGKMVPSSRSAPAVPVKPPPPVVDRPVAPPRWDYEDSPVSAVPVSSYPVSSRRDGWSPAGPRRDEWPPREEREEWTREDWPPAEDRRAARGPARRPDGTPPVFRDEPEPARTARTTDELLLRDEPEPMRTARIRDERIPRDEPAPMRSARIRDDRLLRAEPEPPRTGRTSDRDARMAWDERAVRDERALRDELPMRD
ncbi:MAG: hypothetical protein V7603_6587, partial [Micromonosporaceae bacterium]